MSKISDFHDAVRARMTALFPSKNELSDNTVIDNNDLLTLEDGYAVQFAAGNNTFRAVGCKFSLQRTIVITLTKAVRAGHKSIEKIAEVEKALLEDHRTLVEDFSENENLGTIVSKRNYSTDSGIERVIDERRTFLMIRTNFDIEYLEDFT
jgi:hypothetical protein